ncbi:MAG: hypothetical protein IH988_10790 [Planctomycetes bacterium]|nr:hypothetical protein [Planctomycetota bacterium]
MMGSRLVVLLLLAAVLGGCMLRRADAPQWKSQTRITRYFTDLADGDRVGDADIKKMRRLIEKDWRDHQAKLADQQKAMTKQADATAKLLRSAKQDGGKAVIEQPGADTSAADKQPPAPSYPRPCYHRSVDDKEFEG